MLTESQILLRILVAAGLGLVVGYERERQDHAAGLRTHMVLVVGAALAMTISINLAAMAVAAHQAGDPARLAAQVVSGIGFLGAGVIFRYGTNIHGLTTAASLWTITMVGLAVGAGLFFVAAAVTAFLLLILSLLNYIEGHFIVTYNRVHITIQAGYRDGLVDEVRSMFRQDKRTLNTLYIERDLPTQVMTLNLMVRILSNDPVERIIDALAGIPGVSHVRLSE